MSTIPKPLISITTPCWNSANTIERTINSVLAQEFKDYEYIIVDGGSSDGTVDIIKKYEPLFEGRMRWRSEPDRGLYDAFNKGIEQSTGRYCWNVNSDDYLTPNALSIFADYIKKHPEYLVFSAAMHYVDVNGNWITDSFSSKEREDFNYKNNGMGVIHPATIVNKNIYDLYGTYDIRFKICADIDWFNRIHNKGVPILHLKEFVITMTDGGISHNSSYVKHARDRWLLFSKRYNNIAVQSYYFIIWSLHFFKKEIATKSFRGLVLGLKRP